LKSRATEIRKLSELETAHRSNPSGTWHHRIADECGHPQRSWRFTPCFPRVTIHNHARLFPGPLSRGWRDC